MATGHEKKIRGIVYKIAHTVALPPRLFWSLSLILFLGSRILNPTTHGKRRTGKQSDAGEPTREAYQRTYLIRAHSQADHREAWRHHTMRLRCGMHDRIKLSTYKKNGSYLRDDRVQYVKVHVCVCMCGGLSYMRTHCASEITH